MDFDLVILGDTPEALSAAREAASLGQRCAVLRPDFDGGISSGVNAVIATFGSGGSFERNMRFEPKSASELWRDAVRRHERSVALLARDAAIRVLRGPARLAGKSSAEVFVAGVSHHLEADLLLIATGTTRRKRHSGWLDGKPVIVPEDVGALGETPRRVVVLGGSITGTAFAHLFAAAGAIVTVIDPDAVHVGASELRGIRSRVNSLHTTADGVSIQCDNGESVAADAVLSAERRVGATAALGLAIAELEADDEGRLWCDEHGFTWQPTIAAAGEVVGFPQEIARDRDAARRLVASRFPRRVAGRIDSGCQEPPSFSRRRYRSESSGATSCSRAQALPCGGRRLVQRG